MVLFPCGDGNHTTILSLTVDRHEIPEMTARFSQAENEAGLASLKARLVKAGSPQPELPESPKPQLKDDAESDLDEMFARLSAASKYMSLTTTYYHLILLTYYTTLGLRPYLYVLCAFLLFNNLLSFYQH
ncbi:hypothetical protein K504DRAFT_7561 [Pleomassaria siparia CBS 279.74]|uniref:Uncharacterized protein n=1 Tax=Pleomassaria siparia CBS 279.74 TaxID=1314801 RepID=A0A6G1KQ93_9PLEO|nr:hypothetical protein K504DRAFT_7561 [Pleomassaria siparia CBS 279.74]